MKNALYIVYTNRNEVSAALQRDPCERFYPFIYLFTCWPYIGFHVVGDA